MIKVALGECSVQLQNNCPQKSKTSSIAPFFGYSTPRSSERTPLQFQGNILRFQILYHPREPSHGPQNPSLPITFTRKCNDIKVHTYTLGITPSFLHIIFLTNIPHLKAPSLHNQNISLIAFLLVRTLSASLDSSKSKHNRLLVKAIIFRLPTKLHSFLANNSKYSHEGMVSNLTPNYLPSNFSTHPYLLLLPCPITPTKQHS